MRAYELIETSNNLIGPHNEREFELMLKGVKPAAMVDLPFEFMPYVKNGQFKFKELMIGVRKRILKYGFAQKNEGWRLDKIQEIYDDVYKKGFMSLDDHRKLGKLFGYSNKDIEHFITRRQKSMRAHELTENIKKKDIKSLTNMIDESPKWDLGGYWITDTGEILKVDHNNDIHHADIALSKYKDNIDTSAFEPHAVGEYIRDLARETAMDNGWIQVSTSSKELGVLFKPHQIKKKNLKKLINLVKHDQEYERYVFDIGRFTTEYYTKREALRHLAGFLV